MKHSPKTITILYNPKAGFFKQKYFQRVCSYLTKAGASLAIDQLTDINELDQIIEKTLERQDDLILIAGGDGSIHHAVNSLIKMQEKLKIKKLPVIGVVPTGTANVIAIELGVNISAKKLCEKILNLKAKTIQLFQINDHSMIQMASLGFDAKIVKNTKPWLKKIISKGAYVMTAMIELFKHQKDYEIIIDQKIYHAQLIIILNGRHYAGNYSLAPKADLSNAELSIVLLKKITLGTFVRFIGKIMRKDFSNTANISFLKAQQLSFKDLPSRTLLQIDGEPFEVSAFKLNRSKEIKMIALTRVN